MAPIAESGGGAEPTAGLASMEVHRRGPRLVVVDMVVPRTAPEGGYWERSRWLQDIAWEWPDDLGAFILHLLGVLRPLPDWPPPWPAWTLPGASFPPGAGDPALLCLEQRALLPGTTPYLRVLYDEAAGGCRVELADAYLPGVKAADRKRAERGQVLLQEQPGKSPRGRKPRANDTPAMRETRRRIVEAVLKAKAREPRRSLQVIAEADHGTPYSTFRDWLEDYEAGRL